MIFFFLKMTAAVTETQRRHVCTRICWKLETQHYCYCINERLDWRTKVFTKRNKCNPMLLNERARHSANHREASLGDTTRIKTRLTTKWRRWWRHWRRCWLGRVRRRIKTPKIWCSISKLALKAACLLRGFMARL